MENLNSLDSRHTHSRGLLNLNLIAGEEKSVAKICWWWWIFFTSSENDISAPLMKCLEDFKKLALVHLYTRSRKEGWKDLYLHYILLHVTCKTWQIDWKLSLKVISTWHIWCDLLTIMGQSDVRSDWYNVECLLSAPHNTQNLSCHLIFAKGDLRLHKNQHNLHPILVQWTSTTKISYGPKGKSHGKCGVQNACFVNFISAQINKSIFHLLCILKF